MGTKNKPGKFDCYHSAEPDEPMFVLLGRDPLAPVLVRLWAALRSGDLKSANQATDDAFKVATAFRHHWGDSSEKVTEALHCSEHMVEYGEQYRTEKVQLDQYDQAFAIGARSHEVGDKITNCPYIERSMTYRAWRAGWIAAQNAENVFMAQHSAAAQ